SRAAGVRTWVRNATGGFRPSAQGRAGVRTKVRNRNRGFRPSAQGRQGCAPGCETQPGAAVRPLRRGHGDDRECSGSALCDHVQIPSRRIFADYRLLNADCCNRTQPQKPVMPENTRDSPIKQVVQNPMFATAGTSISRLLTSTSSPLAKRARRSSVFMVSAWPPKVPAHMRRRTVDH
ncbi:MAG: hypothetical protein RLZZ436_4056, partial [Planctomycetota bacterium]